MRLGGQSGAKSLVSLAGLMLDLAVAFAISAGIASAYEWWGRRHWQYSLRRSFAVWSPHCNRASWWRLSINKCERESQRSQPYATRGLMFRGVVVAPFGW